MTDHAASKLSILVGMESRRHGCLGSPGSERRELGHSEHCDRFNWRAQLFWEFDNLRLRCHDESISKSSRQWKLFLSTDDWSLQTAPAPSLPSSTDKLSFELDDVDLLPFPIPLIKYFPTRLPEFHDDGTRQWLPEQKRPNCDGTFYLNCCEQGPPTNGVGRASPRTKDHIDLPKRRKKCKRCKFPKGRSRAFLIHYKTIESRFSCWYLDNS